MDIIIRIDWIDGVAGPTLSFMTLALGFLGLCAGVLTTLAGQGGGLFLLLLCSVLLGPRSALAITAPALLLGNLHRAVLFRRVVDRGVAARMILGAVPGAFAGGFLAGRLPEWVLHVLLVGITALSVARALRWLAFEVPRGALGPAGFLIGAMTGTSGGAGVLFAPVLLSSGLVGRPSSARSRRLPLPRTSDGWSRTRTTGCSRASSWCRSSSSRSRSRSATPSANARGRDCRMR